MFETQYNMVQKMSLLTKVHKTLKTEFNVVLIIQRKNNLQFEYFHHEHG